MGESGEYVVVFIEKIPQALFGTVATIMKLTTIGSGFITLTATLSVIPTIPVAGQAQILGIDRFMSETRALTL